MCYINSIKYNVLTESQLRNLWELSQPTRHDGKTTLWIKRWGVSSPNSIWDDNTARKEDNTQWGTHSARTQMLGLIWAHTHTLIETKQEQTVWGCGRVKSWEVNLRWLACSIEIFLSVWSGEKTREEERKKTQEHKNGWMSCYANERYNII